MRTTGTVIRGIRTPIIRQGDNLPQIVVNSLLECVEAENITLNNKDVVGITEAVVARSQGNYASIDDIAEDVKQKFPSREFGIVFPILSRNRFSVCLKGLLKGAKKVTILLSYPSDEVGNELVDIERLDEKNINPYTDIFTEAQFREIFGSLPHKFTGVDYMEYYHKLADEFGVEVEIILANEPNVILKYTKNVICCDIHSRQRTSRRLKAAGAEKVVTLDNILSENKGSGFNENYGLLGSNKATETSVKLFPRNCEAFVKEVQQLLYEKTNKKLEVLVYGDGAFKDPAGKIWELADPCVSPGYTEGLVGLPNEIKLKYVADNYFPELSGEELKEAITKYIIEKNVNLNNAMNAMGTTPRRLTDLIGSLCDLTSGSGDKGTPVILIQGYFDNYSDNI